MIPAGTINIASHLAVMAHRQPQTVAIHAPHRRRVGYVRRTYLELDRQSDAIARGFGAIGLGVGTRVAVCLRPGVDFFAVTFALFKLGAVPVLIDPGIGLKNFGRCLAEAEPGAFVGLPVAHLLRRALGWAKRTARVHVTTGWFGGRSLRGVERRGAAGGPPVLVNSAPDDPAAILFTSGSTGPPKGVLYTHGNFDAQVHALRDVYGIEPGEIDLATFPLFGLFGPALGMTTVIPRMDFTRPGFVDPRAILEPIHEFGVTNLFGSPALLDRVGTYAAERQQEMTGDDGGTISSPSVIPQVGREDRSCGVRMPMQMPSLNRVISAGAPVSAEIIERFARLLRRGAQVSTPYGATEALPVCSIGSDEILSQTARLTDAGKGVCVGRPVAGIEVYVIGISDEPIAVWSDRLTLATGEIGEIVVKGPQVTREYFNRLDATSFAKIADPAGGFFHRMGDVGYFDEGGRLWFCGRQSQRVKMPGGDWYTAPVEGVFNAHPAVARSALVGVERAGVMRAVICVEVRKGMNSPGLPGELRALADLDGHTRGVKDFLFHPGFPVDIRHNAKIGREKLAAWAAERLK